MKKRYQILGFIVFLIIGLIFGLVISGNLNLSKNTFAVKDKPKEAEILNPTCITPDLFVKIAEKVKPAVVNIYTTQVIKRRGFFKRFEFGPDVEEFFKKFFGDDFFKFFEIPEGNIRRRSLGSGFIISEDGYILTNYHVIENATEIKVSLSDKEVYKAKKVGQDKKTDIALIKINAKRRLPTVILGDSDNVKVGEWVVAIGNPFGLGHTVTVGIVSATGRELRELNLGPYVDFIQTDASINPGNSGGPLINIKGEVIGINTAIKAGATGIGFAIPINIAKEFLPELKEKGYVTRGWLGVAIQDITPEIAESLGIPCCEGALVASVKKGNPADKAGIKRGDVIIEYNGKKVKSSRKLSEMVAATRPGKEVTIKVIRDGKEKIIKVKIGKMPEEKLAKEEETTEEKLGIVVRNITPDLEERLGESEGVVIVKVKPGSPADDAGLQKWDVIKEINRKRIKDVEDYRKVMSKIKPGKSILFLISREGETFYVAIKIE